MTESKPTYCAWDGVSGPGEVHSKLIDIYWQERQRRRVGFLRNWPGEGAAIAAEMEARLSYWREKGGAGGLSEACLAAIVAVFCITLFVTLQFRLFAAALWVYGGIGAFLLIGNLIYLKGRRRRRVFSTLTEDTCPTCGYDLSNLAYVPLGDESVRLGPPACPECGAPWPLVPPPALWIPDDSRES